LSCEGKFLAELIAFASTSLGAAKVIIRAAAISIPGFADQEQASLLNGSILCVDLEFGANWIRL